MGDVNEIVLSAETYPQPKSATQVGSFTCVGVISPGLLLELLDAHTKMPRNVIGLSLAHELVAYLAQCTHYQSNHTHRSM